MVHGVDAAEVVCSLACMPFFHACRVANGVGNRLMTLCAIMGSRELSRAQYMASGIWSELLKLRQAVAGGDHVSELEQGFDAAAGHARKLGL